MALTEIEYGALASSDVMNNNFEYLDNRITDVSETLIETNAAINSNIVTINGSISSLTEEVNQSLEELNSNITQETEQTFSENGLYVTTYRNGLSWYREYFSDKEKTKRVWIEQGGEVYQNNYVSYIRPMSDTNYNINIQDINNSFIEGSKPSSISKVGFNSSFRYGCNIRWYVAGV